MRRRIARTPKRGAKSKGRRCPSGKTRFRDHASAAAALTVNRSGSKRDVVPVRAYPCDRCKGWHITSQAR